MTEFAISEGAISETTLGIPGPSPYLPYDVTVSRYADSLALYLPGGPLFSAKFIEGSNFRALLKGLARRLVQADGYIDELLTEYLPDTTNLFLDEWEFVLGIPDSCFDGSGTATERRTAILVKLSALGVQTQADFVALAAKFGVSINVHPGIEVYNTPSLAPGISFTSEKQARFTIVVTYNLESGQAFPYIYPIPFGTSEIAVLQCLFRKVKPANVQVIFQKV
jgi:uncharacterized protein YmfQ (DUF2313 family)